MDIDQLRYFTVIAKYENMSRASLELNLPQPSLSMSLKRLEASLGVKLFSRENGRLKLNPYGETFFRHCNVILDEYKKALKDIEKLQRESSSQITVGVADWGFPLYVFANFINTHPDIKIDSAIVSSMKSDDFYDYHCDFLISPLPADYKHAVFTVLRKEEIYLTCSPRHPFSEKRSIRLYELNDTRLLIAGSNSHFGGFIRKLLSDAGVKPKETEACVAGYLKRLLNTSDCLAMTVPGMESYMVGDEDIVRTPFDPPIYRYSGLFYDENILNNKNAKLFYEHLTQYFSI